MKFLKFILGLLCPFVGALGPFAFYYSTNSPTPDPLPLLGIVGVSAVLCLLAFVATRFLFKTAISQAFGGAAVSILLMVGGVLVGSALDDSLGETVAWLPVILIFGIMAMTPLMAMTWLGTRLMFGKSEPRSVTPPTLR